MTSHQLTALSWPCRSPDDRDRPLHARWLREGDLIVTLILTVDLDEGEPGDTAGFLPPGFAPAAWHASAALHSVPPGLGAFAPDPLTSRFSDHGIEPVPVAAWSRPELLLARRLILEVLGDVGAVFTHIADTHHEMWWKSHSCVHCWRPLTRAERDTLTYAGRLN